MRLDVAVNSRAQEQGSKAEPEARFPAAAEPGRAPRERQQRKGVRVTPMTGKEALAHGHRSTKGEAAKRRARNLLVGAGLLGVICLTSCARLRRSKPLEANASRPEGALLASPAAFDLVESEGGAWLVWAPKQGGTAVWASAIDANGSLNGNPKSLLERRDVQGTIGELAVAHAHGNLALAWLERTAGEGFPCYPWFESDPFLANLRAVPEGASFLRELGRRHAYFTREFSWPVAS